MKLNFSFKNKLPKLKYFSYSSLIHFKIDLKNELESQVIDLIYQLNPTHKNGEWKITKLAGGLTNHRNINKKKKKGKRNKLK